MPFAPLSSAIVDCRGVAAFFALGAAAGAAFEPVPYELASELAELADRQTSSWQPILKLLSESSSFTSAVWERRPLHVPSVRRSSQHAAAGRSIGLSMGDVKSVIDAGLVYEGNSNQSAGAIKISHASAVWDSVAAVCTETSDAFGLPVDAEIHVTVVGQEVAQSPQSVAHDLLILQTQGRALWSLYDPPFPSPLAENRTIYRPRSVDAPKLNVTMQEGDLLYVPRGIAHESSAISGAVRQPLGTGDEHSVHVALSLETTLVQATYNNALLCGATLAASERAGSSSTTWLSSFLSSLRHAQAATSNAELRAATPVGFMARATTVGATVEKALDMAHRLVLPLMPSADAKQAKTRLHRDHMEAGLRIVHEEASLVSALFRETHARFALQHDGKLSAEHYKMRQDQFATFLAEHRSDLPQHCARVGENTGFEMRRSREANPPDPEVLQFIDSEL